MTLPAPVLHLKVLHSPHAHARIVSIHRAAALAVPGVHRVYTWEDVPRNRFTTAIHTDQLVDPDDTYILDRCGRKAGRTNAIAGTAPSCATHRFCVVSFTLDLGNMMRRC